MPRGRYQYEYLLPLVEGISVSWKKRLAGDIVREANLDEVRNLRTEARALKQTGLLLMEQAMVTTISSLVILLSTH